MQLLKDLFDFKLSISVEELEEKKAFCDQPKKFTKRKKNKFKQFSTQLDSLKTFPKAFFSDGISLREPQMNVPQMNIRYDFYEIEIRARGSVWRRVHLKSENSLKIYFPQ